MCRIYNNFKRFYYEKRSFFTFAEADVTRIEFQSTCKQIRLPPPSFYFTQLARGNSPALSHVTNESFSIFYRLFGFGDIY